MPATFKYVLKDKLTNQYLTTTGWSNNIEDAKQFDPSVDLDNLSSGYYIQEFLWTVS